MSSRILSVMAQVAALTRAGKLTEATAQIQQLLGRTPAPVANQAAAPDAHPADMIEGTFTRLDPAGVNPEPVRKPMARQPLAETLQHIARGGMPASKGARTVAGPVDRHLTSHSFTGPQGTRDYLLYLPDTPHDGPRPLILMLHGCTQSPRDFATGTGMNAQAAARGWIVVYPAQPAGANMNKCWNWFRPADQARDQGEPAVLAGIVREVIGQHGADPARVYVAGLSAGGATAVVLGQVYPDLFAAVGVHSGLAAGSARDVPSAFAAMRNGAAGAAATQPIPTIVFHGTADATVDVKNAEAVAGQAQHGLSGKREVTRGRSGRTYTRNALTAPEGRSVGEVWLIDGAGHAWAGGNASGSFTDPTGPDASAQMLRFFAQHDQN